jgi:hypothetical protein
VEDIDLLSGFCLLEIQIIAKTGFWKKKSAEPSNVFTLPKLEIFNSENVI